MTDHKFTDDEIIKALECHADEQNACAVCPYRERGGCSLGMSSAALDLINRQTAEIERLNKEVDRLSQCVLYHDGIVSDLEKDVFNAKSEAIKEFAERLKPKLSYYDEVYVDALVKEMTEENNESQNT